MLCLMLTLCLFQDLPKALPLEVGMEQQGVLDYGDLHRYEIQARAGDQRTAVTPPLLRRSLPAPVNSTWVKNSRPLKLARFGTAWLQVP